jgi:hypothetical protein
MSLTHFHPEGPFGKGRAPCGKRLNLCDWATGESLVTCSACRQAIEFEQELDALQRHIGQLEDENNELRVALRDAERGQ